MDPDSVSFLKKTVVISVVLTILLVCGFCGWFWYFQCLNRHPSDMIGLVCGTVGNTGVVVTRNAEGGYDAEFHPGTIQLTLTAEATD